MLLWSVGWKLFIKEKGKKKKIFNRSPYLTLQRVIFTFLFESFKTIYQDPKKRKEKKKRTPHERLLALL